MPGRWRAYSGQIAGRVQADRVAVHAAPPERDRSLAVLEQVDARPAVLERHPKDVGTFAREARAEPALVRRPSDRVERCRPASSLHSSTTRTRASIASSRRFMSYRTPARIFRDRLARNASQLSGSTRSRRSHVGVNGSPFSGSNDLYSTESTRQRRRRHDVDVVQHVANDRRRVADDIDEAEHSEHRRVDAEIADARLEATLGDPPDERGVARACASPPRPVRRGRTAAPPVPCASRPAASPSSPRQPPHAGGREEREQEVPRDAVPRRADEERAPQQLWYASSSSASATNARGAKKRPTAASA